MVYRMTDYDPRQAEIRIMSESAPSPAGDTNEAEPTTNDEDDYDWYVSEDGMYLAKDNYEYVLGMNGLAVTFDGVRDPDSDYNDGDDGEWELRNGHETQGYFNPDVVEVPETVAMAFRVLANEL